MTEKVKGPARRYVDAVAREDLAALVESFAPDARIIDVSRNIDGRDAIRSWARNEVIGGRLTVLGVEEDRRDGQLLLVHFAPGGHGGFRAHYNFSFDGDQIRTADLQYA